MWISNVIYHTMLFVILPVILVLLVLFTFKIYKNTKKGRKFILISFIPMLFFVCCVYISTISGLRINCSSMRYLCILFSVVHFIYFSFLIYYIFRKNFVYSPLNFSAMLIMIYVFQSFLGSVSASMIYFSCIG